MYCCPEKDSEYAYRFGVKYVVIAFGASACRMLGSLKSWKEPMIEKIVAMTSEPRIAGILIARTTCHWDAPPSRR